MQNLRNQIKEAFFNPALYFLPTIVFVLANDFWGASVAWKVSFPVAFGLVFYMYYQYQRVFVWHGIFATSYFIIGIVATHVSSHHLFYPLVDKAIFALVLILVIVRKKSLEKFSRRAVLHQIPMTNNALLMKRIAKKIFIAILFYMVSYTLVVIFAEQSFIPFFHHKLKIILATLLLFFTLYETFRVLLLRYGLERQDWLPIVDDKGRVTGSVQYQPNEINDTKLMHPVVRFYYIDNRKVLLRQRCFSDPSEPALWDSSISHKVRLNESVEESLQEQSTEFFQSEIKNPMFLTNYTYEGKFCVNYIYLFVSCHHESISRHEDDPQKMKWWTTSQIESNLGSGIFSERFEQEYEILKRSGLIEGERFCDCDCVLRDTITKITENNTETD